MIVRVRFALYRIRLTGSPANLFRKVRLNSPPRIRIDPAEKLFMGVGVDVLRRDGDIEVVKSIQGLAGHVAFHVRSRKI
jgi:hypothetical protein